MKTEDKARLAAIGIVVACIVAADISQRNLERKIRKANEQMNASVWSTEPYVKSTVVN